MALSGVSQIASVHADGRVQFRGYSPMKDKLVSLGQNHVVLHSPGDTYYDNGGAHYVGATYRVYDLIAVTGRPGQWPRVIHLGRLLASWHSIPKTAVGLALADLEARKGDS